MLRAYFDLTAAMILVGSTMVVGKVINAQFPVMLACGLRFAIASSLLVPWLIKKEGWPRLALRDWLILALMALCGQFGFTILLLEGLKRTSALEAGLISSTTPAMMALVALVVLRERLTLVRAGAVVLAAAGLAVVTVGPRGVGPVSAESWLGNLLVLGAVAGEAVFLLLRKTIRAEPSNLAVSTLLSFLGLIMFLPPAAYQAIGFAWGRVDWSGWAAIIYFGAFFTVAAYLFWFRGVTKVSGQTAGVFSAVMPVSAGLLAWLFLGETLTWVHLLGGGLVLTAIAIMALSEKK